MMNAQKNLIVALFLTTTAAASVLSSSAVVATTTMNQPVNTNFHVRASFHLHSHVYMTREDQLFTTECLQRSFNTAFQLVVADDTNTNDSEIARMKSENHLLQDSLPQAIPMLDTDESHAPTLLFKWTVDWITPAAACPRCVMKDDMLWVPSHDDNSTISSAFHQQWESDFCTLLRDGPLDLFHHDVDSCRIAISSSTTEPSEPAIRETLKNAVTPSSLTTTPLSAVVDLKGRRQVVFHVRASMDLPVDDELSADELLFTTDSLRLSYNEIHQHEDDIYMDRTTLEHHYTIPHTVMTTTTSTAAALTTTATATNEKMVKPMLRGSSLPSFSFAGLQDVQEYTYIFSWEASAACRYCALHSDQHHHVVVLEEVDTSSKDIVLVKHDDVSKQGGHHEQQDWELALCDKLRSGPIEIFKKVKSCSVVIYMDPQQGQRVGVESSTM